jgi:hypothetical protein
VISVTAFQPSSDDDERVNSKKKKDLQKMIFGLIFLGTLISGFALLEVSTKH